MMLIIKEEYEKDNCTISTILIEPPKSFKINVLTNIVPCTIINGMINFKIKCIIDVIKGDYTMI